MVIRRNAAIPKAPGTNLTCSQTRGSGSLSEIWTLIAATLPIAFLTLYLRE